MLHMLGQNQCQMQSKLNIQRDPPQLDMAWAPRRGHAFPSMQASGNADKQSAID